MPPELSQSSPKITLFSDINDVGELQRIAAYFHDQATHTGARLLLAEAAASKNGQLLEQKTRGFSLLARLSSDASATKDPTIMARMVAVHINSDLNMNRTVVLSRETEDTSFRVLGSAGYSNEEMDLYASLCLDLSREVVEGTLPISALVSSTEADRQAFGIFEIPYFMALPVVTNNQVAAIIVTGRIRQQQPFSPPLNEADFETLVAISGFFAAYLARYRLILRDSERIADVESIVTERTAEIEAQRSLLDASLLELHATQQQLILREKLASLGELMAGIAHEIRNPLNFINNFADLSEGLISEIRDMFECSPQQSVANWREDVLQLFGTLRSNLGKIAVHGRRADSIVRNMLMHSRGEGGNLELCDLNAIICESIEYAYHAAHVQYPELRVTIVRDLGVSLDALMLRPQEISRVFVSVISNAFYALNRRQLDASGDYIATLMVTSLQIDGNAEVRFRDNGCGIPKNYYSSIFSPFFTTKPPGEGTGLGLSLSYDIIVNGHGGSIEVDSSENEYTEFIIKIPLLMAPTDISC